MNKVENYSCPECFKDWSYAEISPGTIKEMITIELGVEKEVCPSCMKEIIYSQKVEIEFYEDSYEEKI